MSSNSWRMSQGAGDEVRVPSIYWIQKKNCILILRRVRKNISVCVDVIKCSNMSCGNIIHCYEWRLFRCIYSTHSAASFLCIGTVISLASNLSPLRSGERLRGKGFSCAILWFWSISVVVKTVTYTTRIISGTVSTACPPLMRYCFKHVGQEQGDVGPIVEWQMVCHVWCRPSSRWLSYESWFTSW